MSALGRLVKHGLKTRPILTNAVIYGTMFVGAECLNQTLTRKIFVEHPVSYDAANMGRCAIFGTFGQGPLMTVWYKWLDKTFPGTDPKTIVLKLIQDQMCFTPCLYVCFFVGMSIMERREDLFEELRLKFKKTFLTSCCFWFPVQSGNFYFVPPVYRVIYMGCAAFFWVTILCYIKSQKTE